MGCGFKAEVKGEQVVRMTPWKDGQANEGHSCVKGRFAWGYATHKDRITTPMIRKKITDPWTEVSWDDAIAYAASEFKRIQADHGRGTPRVAGQSLIRVVFGDAEIHPHRIEKVAEMTDRDVPAADRVDDREAYRIGRVSALDIG